MLSSPICFKLLMQFALLPLSRAWLNAGSSIEARIAMIAMTTRSSIRVNGWCFISFFLF